MFQNALIGINQSEGRDAALLARRLCGPNARLTLAHVHGEYALLGPAYADTVLGAELRAAQVALARATTETGITDTLTIGAVSVGDGLGRLAVQISADLLVVGSIAHDCPGSIGLDDWLAQNLTSAPCAVAVAPSGYATQAAPLASIGVLFDDSRESRHALVVARHLAAEHAGRLIVFQARRGADHLRRRDVTSTAAVLEQFSACVDLLVTGAPASGTLHALHRPISTLALTYGSKAPVLLVTHLTPTPLGEDAPAEEEWTTHLPLRQERSLST